MQFQKLDKHLSETNKVFWQMDPVKKILVKVMLTPAAKSLTHTYGHLFYLINDCYRHNSLPGFLRPVMQRVQGVVTKT